MRRHDPRRAWARRVTGDYQPAVRAEVGDDDADQAEGRLYLYDPIDSWFGVTARDFAVAMDQLGDVDTVALHINSPGGDVFDGLAILNTIRQHPATVTAIVDGLAASIASVIAVGADATVMSPNAEMAIHDAWGLVVGPAEDMRAMADQLDMHSDNIADVYAAKAGGERGEWRSLMRAETWYVGDEAVDAGLADRLGSQASNRVTMRPAAKVDRAGSGLERFSPKAIPSIAARRGND